MALSQTPGFADVETEGWRKAHVSWAPWQATSGQATDPPIWLRGSRGGLSALHWEPLVPSVWLSLLLSVTSRESLWYVSVFPPQMIYSLRAGWAYWWVWFCFVFCFTLVFTSVPAHSQWRDSLSTRCPVRSHLLCLEGHGSRGALTGLWSDLWLDILSSLRPLVRRISTSLSPGLRSLTTRAEMFSKQTA